MLAVVLALLSAALFGAMTVALRFGFREENAPDPGGSASDHGSRGRRRARRTVRADLTQVAWKLFAAAGLFFGIS